VMKKLSAALLCESCTTDCGVRGCELRTIANFEFCPANCYFNAC
jgi:hypothetical protein